MVENEGLLSDIKYLKKILAGLFKGLESESVMKETLMHYSALSLKLICKLERDIQELGDKND